MCIFKCRHHHHNAFWRTELLQFQESLMALLSFLKICQWHWRSEDLQKLKDLFQISQALCEQILLGFYHIVFWEWRKASSFCFYKIYSVCFWCKVWCRSVHKIISSFPSFLTRIYFEINCMAIIFCDEDFLW